MKKKIYIQIFFAIITFFIASNAFSKTYGFAEKETLILKKRVPTVLTKVLITEEQDILTVYKKSQKGLDVYTFNPGKKSDKELMTAIENRLKNTTTGFVSLSSNSQNTVKLVIDPSKIKKHDFEVVMGVVVKMYEYYPTNYNIIEE